MKDPALDPCGCCEGPEALTPASRVNPPGLSALAYRVGTQGRFKYTMQLGLSAFPELRALATRDDNDPAIALLDAWAVVLDVLTFYQERIANEGYLRTSTERRSLLELARAIGYELRPGVAAGTYLAFTMDNVVGSPPQATLAIGTKAQSVPGQDEKPQIFETVEEIEARPTWNALRPQLFEPSLPLKLGKKKIYLKGTATGLKIGDTLLIVGDERKQDATNENWDFRRVSTLETVSFPVSEGPGAGYTVVTLNEGLGTFVPKVTHPAQKNPQIYALRQRAAAFGYNAVDWKALHPLTKKAYLGLTDAAVLSAEQSAEWPNFALFSGSTSLDLDAVYPKIVSGKGWLIVSTPDYQEVYQIESAVESARAEFSLSGKTTLVSLKGENFDRFTDARRTAVIYAESEALEWADKPVTSLVSGGEIVLSPAVDDLKAGRLLSVTGVDDATGEWVSEIIEIKTASTTGDLTTIGLAANLVYSYQRDTVTINANVARATHGDTKKDEILGSGDGSVPFQQFALKQKPLTYISAANASGAESTLEIRVKNVLWHEVPSFYGVKAGDRVFATRRADDGTVWVEFGDGKTGARLPTGANNLKATYRVGIGLEGMVDAGQISQLLSRPLGLKAVINPVAATGADDPEELADARDNAPLTVLTLDRIVSVQDFEDFARAFSGIGKAQATLLWSGERQIIHLTVADAKGGVVLPGSDLHTHLLEAIDAARHTDQPVRVSPLESRVFTLSARVATEPDLVRSDVLTAVTTALTDAFSFSKRAFGQGVSASEILAVMQGVPGVVAVDLETLNGLNPITHPNIPARIARWDTTTIKGAELLLIDPLSLTFTELPV